MLTQNVLKTEMLSLNHARAGNSSKHDKLKQHAASAAQGHQKLYFCIQKRAWEDVTDGHLF